MFSFIKDRWESLFSHRTQTHLSANSTLKSIEKAYPHLGAFIFERYRISISEDNTRSMTLKNFVEKYALPPAQILFMELQMQERLKKVKIISAKEAKVLIENNSEAVLFDTRDEHEWEHHGKIPNARFLTESNIQEELKNINEMTPIICYCHFGVRSLNFASQIADLGFKEVHTIRGGIDEWSIEVDPKIERYQGDYC